MAVSSYCETKQGLPEQLAPRFIRHSSRRLLVTRSMQSLTLDAVDVETLYEVGLLKRDVYVGMNPNDTKKFGIAYDKKANISSEMFSSQQEVQRRVREYASKRGFAIRVGGNSTNKQTHEGNAKYVCKLQHGQQSLGTGEQMGPCPFYVNAYGKNGVWKIVEMRVTHNHIKHVGFGEAPTAESQLPFATSGQRNHDTSAKTLLNLLIREFVLAYVGSLQLVKGKAIVQFLKGKGYTISRTTASRLKKQMLEYHQTDVATSYQKLQAFLEMTAEANPGSVTAFEKTSTGGFLRASFFPSAYISASKFAMKLVGLDGTHLKGEMNKRGVYLTATTKDYDGHIIVFGFALVPAENYDNWYWFLCQMKAIFEREDVAKDQVASVSDRQKGLLASVEELFPSSCHRFCLRHIVGNIEKLGFVLTTEETGFVYEAARSDCENDWELAISQLRETRAKAAEYLAKIDKKHWVKYAIQDEYGCATYGELTSNLSESANNWIGLECRSARPLEAFSIYFMKVVDQLSERRNNARKMMMAPTSDTNQPQSVTAGQFKPLLTLWADELASRLEASRKCSMKPCMEGVYFVMYNGEKANGYTHPWRTVNLIEHECTCKDWKDQAFPCVHAVYAAVKHGIPVTQLFCWSDRTVETYAKAYSFQFVPTLPTATIKRDTELVMPPEIVEDVILGKRGLKPGPKSKHKRKSAKVGSAAGPNVLIA